jgi:VCBS repeat-containing protein
VPNANLVITGSGGSRNLQITPAANQSGATTITVTVTATNGRTAVDTFVLTVNAVDDAPVANNDSYQTEEYTPLVVNAADGVLDNDTDPDSQSLTAILVSGPATAQSFTLNADGSFNYTPNNNFNGPDTFTYKANDGNSDSNVATVTITVTAVNDAPVNVVPAGQGTAQNTPVVFSAANSNQISVTDPDAGTNIVQVTLTATNGTLTLSGTTGLSFSFTDGNGTGAGDGTADATMTFRGTLANINTALNGMSFTPTNGFSGAATLTITSNDLGNTGTGGPLTDTDVVNIQVELNVSIADSQVTEPAAGFIDMVFTVTLNAPAPAGGASVAFTTQQQSQPDPNHATAGSDYATNAGTITFAPGEQIKTISVNVFADADMSEVDETFLVVLSSPVGVTITDGTATGTILAAASPGTIVISELRTSGPAGAGDDFVEIHNNTDTPHTVNDLSGNGYGLYKMGADCNANPILIGFIPNGTVIPARGHYLFVGSAYSLANYGGSGAAAGDQVMTQDIENDLNVAIFSTTTLTNLTALTRLDAVGFGSNGGGVCDLLREGTNLPGLSGATLQYSYFRDECGKAGNSTTFGLCPTGGLTKDSNNNDEDFIFGDTTGNPFPDQHLAGPGPQNLGSPRLTLAIPAALVDSTVGAGVAPNRIRNLADVVPNAANGTLTVRRRFVNVTGAPVTRLRFRIVDFSSLTLPPIADVRALDSITVTVNGVNDAATCAATGTPATAPCSVEVFGTTLEQPPAQSLGGALNSTLSAGTIAMPTPLAPGQSINLQFRLGVQSPGNFKFFFNVEALP